MGTGAADASEATDFTGALTADGFETLNIKTNQGTNASTAALKMTEIASIIGAHLTQEIALTGHSDNPYRCCYGSCHRDRRVCADGCSDSFR